jgi:propionyl-CoA carboxylase beta chain
MESKNRRIKRIKLFQAHLGGGKDRIAKQQSQKKKLTARERVDYRMKVLEEIVLVTHTVRLISEWQKIVLR